MATWNAGFETTPAGGDSPSQGDDRIRELKTGVRERIEKEHMMNLLSGAAAADGWHKAGSAKAYVGSSAPTTRPDSSTALTADDDGRLWVSTTDFKVRCFRYAAGSTMEARWEVVSSAGSSGAAGINFDNTGFESGTTGYATYDDGASATPVDGTGGTAANLALTRSTVNPLIGLASGLLTKAAADAQGEGLSYDFTIDEGARLAPILISFLYETSANYVDSDMGVYLYDKTNAVFIPISVVNIMDSVGNPAKFEAAFLPNANSGSYRLIWHVQTTSALAYTFQLDSVSVSSQQIASGAAISEWQSYTPSLVGFGTPTSVDFQWRRVGSNLEVKGKFTCGTPTSVEARIPFPSGMTSRPNVPTLEGMGIMLVASATASSFYVLNEASKTYATLGFQSSAQGALVKQNGSAITGVGAVVSVFFSLPIAEGTSNVNLASDFTQYAFNTQATINTNDTTSFGYGMGGAAILAHTAATYMDVSLPNALPGDVFVLEVRSKTDGSWLDIEDADIPSLFVTLKRQAIYNISGGLIYNTGAGRARIAKDKMRIYWMPYAGVAGASYAHGAGTVAFVTWASIVAAADGFDRWRVRKISNGNMAEVPPIVAAEYKTTDSYTGPGISTPINFSVKVADTHNAVTTGASWKFTAPIAGWYDYDATLGIASSQYAAMFKNGLEYKRFGSFGGSTSIVHMPISGKIYLNAGDYIDFKSQATAAVTQAYHFSIAWIGR